MKKNTRIVRRIRTALADNSIRWRYFLMLSLLSIMAVVSLLISESISLRSLTRENLQKMQITLDQNCETLSEHLYAAGQIPATIEETSYYSYLKTEHTSELPEKYPAVLSRVGTILRNQVYLSQGSTHCILYLSGVNSVCTSTRTYIVAEDFTDSISFASQTGDEILELLRLENRYELLPAQDVTFYGRTTERCLSYLVAPRDSSLSILVMYPQEFILKRLGIEALPAETEVLITRSDGTVLDHYPADEDLSGGRCYELTGRLKKLNASVTLRIPQKYFSSLLKPARLSGALVIALTLLIGILLSLFLSRQSVKPLQNILAKHQPGSTADNANELTALDGILTQSRQDVQKAERLLAENLLLAAFSGTQLSRDDEHLIHLRIPQLQHEFRVAILHVLKETSDILSPYLMEDYFDQEYYIVLLDRHEIGILLRSDEAEIARFIERVKKMSTHLCMAGFSVSCGISEPIEDLFSLQNAARQARLALPVGGGIAVYSPNKDQLDAWAMKEMELLHQCLLARRSEAVRSCLRQVEEHADAFNAEMLYYGVQLVLESVRSELSVPRVSDFAVFERNLLPAENIAVVCRAAEELLAQLEPVGQDETEEEEAMVMEYVENNYSDADLCLASAAEQLNLSEELVQRTVRKKTQLSFSKFVLKLRMEHARQMLRTTQLSVRAIAEQCGYQVESTFFRAFKRYYNITPIEYRNSADAGQSD